MRAAILSVMLDLDAASKYIGVSTPQLHRLLADEAVPYRRLGRSLPFPKAQLTAKPRV
jgi:predicted DNA-binding transcriptional regulator AlpA